MSLRRDHCEKRLRSEKAQGLGPAEARVASEEEDGLYLLGSAGLRRQSCCLGLMASPWHSVPSKHTENLHVWMELGHFNPWSLIPFRPLKKGSFLFTHVPQFPHQGSSEEGGSSQFPLMQRGSNSWYGPT